MYILPWVALDGAYLAAILKLLPDKVFSYYTKKLKGGLVWQGRNHEIHHSYLLLDGICSSDKNVMWLKYMVLSGISRFKKGRMVIHVFLFLFEYHFKNKSQE